MFPFRRLRSRVACSAFSGATPNPVSPLLCLLKAFSLLVYTEQPLPTWLFLKKSRTSQNLTAPSRSENALVSYGSGGFRRLGHAVLLLPIANGGADRIFREHRAVNLDRRQSQLFHDVGVLDLHRFGDRLALYPFGCERGGGDGRTAAKGFELCLFNH